MARQEQDREDLLAEATALVERIELAVPHEPDAVVIGFRSDGCASLYFGPDPAYHFNTARELRRAFADELLYKAEERRLVSLDRRRNDSQTSLIAHELDEEQYAAFLAAADARLVRLRDAVADNACRTLRQVPADADVLARVARWLADWSSPPAVAMQPHAQ